VFRFHILDHDFIIYIFFIQIAASSKVNDDATN